MFFLILDKIFRFLNVFFDFGWFLSNSQCFFRFWTPSFDFSMFLGFKAATWMQDFETRIGSISFCWPPDGAPMHILLGCRTLADATGGHVGPAEGDGGHVSQVRIPEVDALLDPEAVAEGVHAVQDKVLPPNPGIKDLRHIRADLLEALLLSRGQCLLLALMIAPVKLIHHEVLDVLEAGLEGLVLLYVDLEVTSVIVHKCIRVDFGHAHGRFHHRDLVGQVLIDQMLFGG